MNPGQVRQREAGVRREHHPSWSYRHAPLPNPEAVRRALAGTFCFGEGFDTANLHDGRMLLGTNQKVELA